MKHKVLIFVQDGVGGAERMSVLIGKNLDSEKYEVCFCVVDSSVKTSIIDFIPHNIHTKRIPNRNPIQLIWNMVMTIIQEKPYAVFSSVFNLSNKYLPFRWLFPKVKVIIRCDNYLYTYNEKQRNMIKKLYPKSDIIITQTDEMKDELVHFGIDKTKLITLHNPVDKQSIDQMINGHTSPYPNNGYKHFVASGRFAYQKGFDLLVLAFSEVKNEYPLCDLYIIGDTSIEGGINYKSVMNIAISQNVDNDVHCVGYQKNPYPYIKYADCFVLSSRWEGLPNVLLESLYLGTPSAAFKCIPVIERLIQSGQEGFLAEKEDVPSLADAMLKTINLGRIRSTEKSNAISDFTDLFI